MRHLFTLFVHVFATIARLLGSGGIRYRQASAVNLESIPPASAESQGIRSFRRRIALPVHAAFPPDPFCNCAETIKPC
jgi:hypothetical protein